MTKIPPRLHVLLARNAQIGLVIRRGPSKQVATILWNRRTDTFQLGQWLRGRLYERRSDLSPDGKYFLYFATKSKSAAGKSVSWSAISRAPYLKALAWFPKSDCWFGGGLWIGKRTYWLNGEKAHTIARENRLFHRSQVYCPPERFGGECPGVYYPRLLRDGWRLQEWIVDRNKHRAAHFEKPLPGGWVLRKITHAQTGPPPGKGCYWDEHALFHPTSGCTIPRAGWEWADLDRNRLVWAEKGKLYAGRLSSCGVEDEAELYDFRAMTFAPIEAPY